MNSPAAILRFVRFPLAWTAVADSTAGAAIAMAATGEWSIEQITPLFFISPGLYLFGMGLNDLLDAREDRQAGRDRPLARDELSAGLAVSILVFLLGLVMIGAACVQAAGLKMVAVTLACIALYNGVAKRWTIASAVFISACRLGNILIGWAVVAGNWRLDAVAASGKPEAAQVPYLAAQLVAVGALTMTASIISGMEKRSGLRSVFGLMPSTAILGTLLLLPVADAVCVTLAWGGAPEGALWLTAVPLVVFTSALVRRLRPLPSNATEPPRSDD
jgi:4-hydroxybenzoate polyprenyltransferase